MKAKASEILFVVICLCAAIVAIIAVVIVRDSSAENELIVSYAEPYAENDKYDVTVINTALLEDFMQVSGIGEVKAGDIIAYRDAIGGFLRVSQLKDVNGISDALYQRIIEYFYHSNRQSEPSVTTALNSVSEEAISSVPTETVITDPSERVSISSETEKKQITTATSAVSDNTVTERVMRSVDINSADAEEIADALMIDIGLAEEIVALRNTIHYFSTVQELDLCSGMTAEIYRRIKDYIMIGK